MHSLIIGAAFLIILLAPCIAAQCESLFPIRLRVQKINAPAPKPRTSAVVTDPILPKHRRRNPTMIRHSIAVSRSSAAHPTAKSSRAA